MFDAIDLSYQDFKNIVLSKKIRPQHILNGNKYELFAYDTPIKYTSHVWADPTKVQGIDIAAETVNRDDFLNNLQPISNRCLLISPIAAQSKFMKGMINLAATDTTGYCEWSFDTDVEVNKALPKPINAELGDYVTFEIWSKPGAIVTPQNPGGDPIRVDNNDFGDGIYVYAGTGGGTVWYQGSGGGKIPSYCTLRCYYHKAAGTARQFLIDVEFIV